MRTTIRLDDDLFQRTKALALRRRTTFTAVVEDALREVVARSDTPPPAKRVPLPVSHRGGLRPGVDLNNNAELLDNMDGLIDPA